MELIFLAISIIMTITLVYLTGRLVFGHRELIRVYKTSGFLGVTSFILGILMVMVFFITLCAINNTFWNFPYLRG